MTIESTAVSFIDGSLSHWAQWARTPALDVVMRVVSFLASGPALILYAGLIAIGFFILKRSNQYWVVFIGVLFSALLTFILKEFFGRSRPILSHQANSFSFPSGHVLISTVFFGLLASQISENSAKNRKWLFSAAFLIVLSVAVSRLYLGEHWVSDVIGGAFFGLIFNWCWISLNQKILVRWNKSHTRGDP